ncbi:MAG: hypothetical protein ACR2FQ_07470, partial [Pseudonocardiaceae bacterium]
RTGTRPERTVYGLTDAGRAKLVERERRLLENPDPDTSLFVAALSFVGCLPPAQAAAALQTRRDTLTARCTEAEDALVETAGTVPRFLLVETEYELARLGSERDWVGALVEDLTSGRLDWPADITQLVAVAPPIGDDRVVRDTEGPPTQ